MIDNISNLVVFSLINRDIIICEGQLFFNSFSECNNWHQNGIPCPDGKYCVDKHCIGNFIKGYP